MIPVILLIMNIIATITFFIYIIIIFIRIHKLDEKVLKEKIKDELKKTNVIRKRMPLKNKLKEVKCMRRKARSKTTSTTMTIKHLNNNKTISGNKIQSQGEDSPKKEIPSPIRLLKYVSHTEGNNDSYFSPKDEFYNENPRLTSRSDEIKLTLESPKDKKSKKEFSIQLLSIKMTTIDNDLNHGILHSEEKDKTAEKTNNFFSINSSNRTKCNAIENLMVGPRALQKAYGKINPNESCEVSLHSKESVANMPNFGLIECASPRRKRPINFSHQQGKKPKTL